MIGGAARAEEGLRKPAVWRYERAEVFFGDEVVEAVYEDGCPRRHCDAGGVFVYDLRYSVRGQIGGNDCAGGAWVGNTFGDCELCHFGYDCGGLERAYIHCAGAR